MTYYVTCINIASLNVGMDQGMLANKRLWHSNSTKLAQVVGRLFNYYKNDMVFLSEFGSYRKGPEYSCLDLYATFGCVVGPEVLNTSIGPFCSIYNGLTNLVQQGFYASSLSKQADMHWQAFLLQCPTVTLGTPGDDGGESDGGGASQPASDSADIQIAFLVGNAHIVKGQNSSTTVPQRQTIVKEFLNFLANLDIGDWKDCDDLPVVRVLIGDPNLDVGRAEEAVQDTDAPISGLPIQRVGGQLAQWHVFSTASGLSGDFIFTTGAVVKTTAAAEGEGKGAEAKGKYGWGGRHGDQALGPNEKKVRSGKHSRWSLDATTPERQVRSNAFQLLAPVH